MGTIVTVHGTYAHLDVAASGDNGSQSIEYWWRPDSRFIADLKTQVTGETGELDIVPFSWSGLNSEKERRQAGSNLYQELLKLEGKDAPYCVVAHSHGGSVLSAALLEAASRNQQLPNLKRWITVGTPFVELRRERFLFMRLSMLLKAMYVASVMLLVIFLGATIGRLLHGDIDFDKTWALWRLGISGIAAALPFIVFLIIATVRERRRRYFNRPRVKERAKSFFANRWLALTHEDDEAVRGRGTLRNVSLPIFDKQFAVPLLSLLSVFMLPAVYLVAIYSPSLMMGLADTLGTRVYELDKLEARAESYKRARSTVRSLRGDLKDARNVANDDMKPIADRMEARKIMKQRRAAIRSEREVLHTAYPDLPSLQRALRFKSRFLETKDGRPCYNGRLCENGNSQALNAKLLLHLITDELTSLFLDDEIQRSVVGQWAGYLLPVLLVPVILGAIAIVWVLFVQLLAGGFSQFASRWLDRMTWDQVRRAAVGNDTEDEVAVGTTPFPRWAGSKRPFLPDPISRDITDRSNEATVLSLAKFRNALSEVAFMDQGERKNADYLLAYLNWNELIHTSYFAVPSFTSLVAYSISRNEGFNPKEDLSKALEQTELASWHGRLATATTEKS